MRSTLTSPGAILARLQIASEEGWALELRVSDGTVMSGIVSLEDEGASLFLVTGQAVSRLRIGAPAHASIIGPEGAVSFYSGVVAAHPDGRVDLEIPRVLRVVDTRDPSRKPVDGRDHVHVVVPLDQRDVTFEVVDLSTRGLSFRVPAQLHQIVKDQRVRLRLKVPGARSLRMIVTVRNLRRDPQVSGSRLVGARVEVGPQDLAGHVAEALKRAGDHAA